MRRLLLISLAAAVAAVFAVAYQVMPHGGRKPDGGSAQTTAPNPVRTIPTRGPGASGSPPAQADPVIETRPPGASGDASSGLGELRTREAPDGNNRPTLTSGQIDALKAQAERRHVRPVTRMSFPLDPGTIVPPQVYLHPIPPEVAGLAPAGDPLGFIAVGDKFVLVGTVSRRIVAVAQG